MAEAVLRAIVHGETVWQRTPDENAEVRVGSCGRDELSIEEQFRSDWVVPDKALSGVHFRISLFGPTLLVRRRLLPQPTSRAILYQGQPTDEFYVNIGEAFIIEHSDTRFEWDVPARSEPVTKIVQKVELRPDALRHFRFDASLFARMARIGTQGDFANQSRQILTEVLQGLTGADGAALVRCETDEGAYSILQTAWRNPKPNDDSDFPVSRKLVARTRAELDTVVYSFVQQSENRQGVTKNASIDWAVCTPTPVAYQTDDGREFLILYVVGRELNARYFALRHTSDIDTEIMQEACAFLQLAAHLIGAVRKTQRLELLTERLRQFPPKRLRPILTRPDYAERTAASERPVTVLFCDLRGSSRAAEAGGSLTDIWRTVRTALNLMTRVIVQNDGVIGDLQGDAAMAFWGWPDAMPDQIDKATAAAVAIVESFRQSVELQQTQFRCGVGVAHGTAVVGLLGVCDQAKIDVFGPVVNRAARLESMTKQLGVQLLVDEEVGAALRAKLSEKSNSAVQYRTRLMGKIRPAGFGDAGRVYEAFGMLDWEERLHRERPHLLQWEAGVQAFMKGNWEQARIQLQQAMAALPDDALGKRYLERMAGENMAPPNWDGVMAFDAK